MTDLLTALRTLPEQLDDFARPDLAQVVRRRARRTRRRHRTITAITAAACLGGALPVVVAVVDRQRPVESLPAAPPAPSAQAEPGLAGVPARGAGLGRAEQSELLAAWEAAAQSQAPVGERSFAYVRLEVLSEHVLPGYRYGVEGEQQLWLADDGTGRGRQTFTPTGVRFWTDQDRTAAEAAGGARPQDHDEGLQLDGAGRTLRYAPPDPDVLLRALQNAAGDLGDGEVFAQAVQALLPPAPSPEWAVRVVAAVGALDGVSWTRDAQLPDGRGGIGLAVSANGRHGAEERRMVLDEASGTLLGALVVREGVVTGYAIPHERGFVADLRSTP